MKRDLTDLQETLTKAIYGLEGVRRKMVKVGHMVLVEKVDGTRRPIMKTVLNADNGIIEVNGFMQLFDAVSGLSSDGKWRFSVPTLEEVERIKKRVASYNKVTKMLRRMKVL